MAKTTKIDHKPVGNLATTRKALASFILRYAPSGLPAFSLQKLQEVIDGVDIASEIYFSFDFYRLGFGMDRWGELPDLNVTLTISLFNRYDMESFEDPDGDIWCTGSVVAEVNWPSYGGKRPNIVAQRISLMHEVCTFAAVVEAQFEPVWHLVVTKAELEQKEAARQQEAAERAAKRLVLENCKGMHQATNRMVTLPDGFDLPVGSYDVAIKNKTYRVRRTSPSEMVVSLSRTELLIFRLPWVVWQYAGMKLFDFECPAGHVTELSFGHLDKIPDEVVCPGCSEENKLVAERIKVYGLAPVRMPTGPATYKQGF